MATRNLTRSADALQAASLIRNLAETSRKNLLDASINGQMSYAMGVVRMRDQGHRWFQGLLAAAPRRLRGEVEAVPFGTEAAQVAYMVVKIGVVEALESTKAQGHSATATRWRDQIAFDARTLAKTKTPKSASRGEQTANEARLLRRINEFLPAELAISISGPEVSSQEFPRTRAPRLSVYRPSGEPNGEFKSARETRSYGDALLNRARFGSPESVPANANISVDLARSTAVRSVGANDQGHAVFQKLLLALPAGVRNRIAEGHDEMRRQTLSGYVVEIAAAQFMATANVDLFPGLTREMRAHETLEQASYIRSEGAIKLFTDLTASEPSDQEFKTFVRALNDFVPADLGQELAMAPVGR